MRLISLVVAALSGVSMALQGAVNAVLGKKVGSIEAAFVVHVVGSAILGAVLLTGMTGGSVKGTLQPRGGPFWGDL